MVFRFIAFYDPIVLLIILGMVAVLIFLGPSRIPQLARSLGQAKREFQRGANGTGDDDLMRAAQTLGISTEGKDRKQISDEVIARLKSKV